MIRFIKKIFPLLFILALAAAGYYYQDWVLKQCDYAKGVYYVYKGDQAYSADNMAKTLEYYDKGLKLFPQHHDAWFNLGNIYAVHEDYYAAIDAYDNALKAKPNFVLAKMNKGIVLSEDLGFFDEAIKQFDEVTNIKFVNITIPSIYSNIKNLKSKENLAYYNLKIPFVYSNLRSSKMNKGLAYYNKGVALRRKALYLPLDKQYLEYEYLGKAIEAYTKAIENIKDSFDVYYNRAIAHHLRGEYREAGLDYCKAIEIEPMNFEGHYNLAVLLRNMDKDRESASELHKAAILISENPASSEVQTTYIFNLLNEVTRRFMTSQKYYTEKITDEPTGGIQSTYINGRIVADDEFDKAMFKNFQTCAGATYFKDEE